MQSLKKSNQQKRPSEICNLKLGRLKLPASRHRAEQERQAKEIEVDRLVFRDKNKSIRMQLSVSSDGTPSMTLHDQEGETSN